MLNVQEMTARALLVDTTALGAAQAAGDVLTANGILMDAFYNDVRPALANWRQSRGLPADPMAAYARSGYQERTEADRRSGTQTALRAARNRVREVKEGCQQRRLEGCRPALRGIPIDVVFVNHVLNWPRTQRCGRGR